MSHTPSKLTDADYREIEDLVRALPRREYEILTAETTPFDTYPSARDGGPHTVTRDGWIVSYSTVTRMFGGQATDEEVGVVTLGAFQSVKSGTKLGGEFRPHALDGTQYANELEAHRAAYEAGLIGFMVYADTTYPA